MILSLFMARECTIKGLSQSCPCLVNSKRLSSLRINPRNAKKDSLWLQKRLPKQFGIRSKPYLLVPVIILPSKPIVRSKRSNSTYCAVQDPQAAFCWVYRSSLHTGNFWEVRAHKKYRSIKEDNFALH